MSWQIGVHVLLRVKSLSYNHFQTAVSKWETRKSCHECSADDRICSKLRNLVRSGGIQRSSFCICLEEGFI